MDLQHQVQYGDSAARIAERYTGDPSREIELILANSQKPYTNVRERLAFTNLIVGEKLNLPQDWTQTMNYGLSGIGLGSSNIVDLNTSGGTNPYFTVTVQDSDTTNGVTGTVDFTVDGTPIGSVFIQGGNGFASGASPRTTVAEGSHTVQASFRPNGANQSNTPASRDLPFIAQSNNPGPPGPPPGGNVLAAAQAAASALANDPNYCTSVHTNGSAVNSAVHNFKTAWNAANPGNRVPVGTGNYEPTTAAALMQALGGQQVPGGCGGVAPGPRPVPTPVPSTPTPPSMVQCPDGTMVPAGTTCPTPVGAKATNWVPWIVAGVAVAAGIGLVVYSQRTKAPAGPGAQRSLGPAAKDVFDGYGLGECDTCGENAMENPRGTGHHRSRRTYRRSRRY